VRQRRARGAAFGVKSTLSAVRVGLYISLNQCSMEPGLGKLLGGRDHLASDEPEALLPSPT